MNECNLFAYYKSFVSLSQGYGACETEYLFFNNWEFSVEANSCAKCGSDIGEILFKSVINSVCHNIKLLNKKHDAVFTFT
jgi:hypothetical protein